MPLLTVEVAIGGGRSLSAAKLTLAALVGAWLLRGARGLRERPPLLLPWLAYLGVGLASALVNGASVGALWHWGESIALFLVFAVASEGARDEEGRKDLLAVLAASGGASVALWFLQRASPRILGVELPLAIRVGVEPGPSFYWGSTLAHQNFFGAFSALAGAIFLSLAAGTRSRARWALVLGAAAAWGLLPGLGSAGSIAGLLVGLLLAPLFRLGRRGRAALAAGALLAAGLAGWATFAKAGWLPLPRSTEESVETRLYASRMGLRSFLGRPLLGAGPGSFEGEVVRLERETASPLPRFRQKSPSIAAHNGYLRVLVETGALGLAAFLVLLASLLRGLWESGQREGSGARWLFVGLSAFAANALFEDIFSYSGLAALFWGLGGMALPPRDSRPAGP